MSSRVFRAHTAHTADNPQLCGISVKEIQRKDWVLFLVILGSDARPEFQIRCVAETQVEREIYDRRKRRKVTKTVTQREYGLNGVKFRTVYGGKSKNEKTGKQEKIFNWQEMTGFDADGEEMWRTVKCWSQLVLADVAESLGYDVRADENGEWVTTVAYEGDRNIGSEHTVEVEEDNAMVTLARAVLSDEEAGLVPPEIAGEEIAAVGDDWLDKLADS